MKKFLFVFDIDDTLIKDKSLLLDDGPIFKSPLEIKTIREQMHRALEQGDDIWILTANFRYTDAHLKKLFEPDTNHLFDKIKIFTRKDMTAAFGIKENDRPALYGINDNGRKPEFLVQKIADTYDLKQDVVHCVLFDDHKAHIDNCSTCSTSRIKIEGYQVNDFKDYSPSSFFQKPTTLSEEFTARVTESAKYKSLSEESIIQESIIQESINPACFIA
ncbi:hypothetical protein [Legionella longbeachae]|uniref:Uncharacterized protein n=1 Tax=Legionella longbeachae serogroup 1 (strain NSW150) TaxID=661367 RepID=D3HJI3_LEGLN|nr:hypothetical protein [Legionella longbeachae]VEE03112.1 Uncharacterised protein [Legionella oakridgensis]HBD7399231.1 hypothetical protein [Legionella pneumophila]ARB93988.1 hypothetical protein A6J40_18155 [Legionella longbeachae]ARM32874.1 hypothetical protein B0B39_04795 [Legionella longbeachae]EEZ94315.1 hypothetical protein LLB_3220 [Legionella longbeachae D-4968]